MAMKHPIDEPDPSKINDLDDMIAQSIKDQATTELMLKLCTIAIILIAILFLVSTFSSLSKDLTLRNFNSEDRQLLTEPSKHNLLCIDGNKLVTITEPIMLITNTSYVTEYKSFFKTNCKVVEK